MPRKRTWPKPHKHDDMRDIARVGADLLAPITLPRLRRLETIDPRRTRQMIQRGSGPFKILKREQRQRLLMWSGREVLLAARSVVLDREEEIAFWTRCEEQGFK